MVERDDMKKAADIIKSSHAPLIVLPKNPSADALAAATLILGRLRKDGKAATVHGEKTAPIGWEFLPLSTLNKPNGLTGETRILIDTRQSPVGGLRYEKTENLLSVILTPKDKSILPSAVRIVSADSTGENITTADCIVALGVRTADELALRFPETPQIVFETPVINIDTGAANEEWGEANLTDIEALSLTEISWQFTKTLSGEPMSKDEAELILAGILWRNIGIIPANSSSEKLHLIAESKESGANDTAMFKAISREHTEKTERIAGRMLARKRFEPAKNISFLMLTPVDFAATASTEGDVLSAFWFLTRKFALGDAAVLLWQKDSSGEIRSFALAKNRELNKELRVALGGKFLGDILSGGKSFSSFKEAEEFILSCIK
ncbi:MAG: hypothetical protein HYT39_01275 [Candidatus Sungbacteria bacterium]|nr:hypothetical protein [Candidatus Sungbacteria bacterium]